MQLYFHLVKKYVSTGGVTFLTINGCSSATTNDAMSIGVSTNGPVTPGSYNFNTIPFPTAVGTYTDTASTNIYLTSFIGLP